MQIVNELSEKLGRNGHDLREVIWADYKGYAPDCPAFALGGKLVLRSELKGELIPDEWRPLLASSLVFETRFRGRERLLRLYALLSLAISISLTLLFFLIITRYLLPPGPVYYLTGRAGRAYSYLLLGFFFVVFFLLMAFPARYFRRVRLRADQMACEEFGTRQDLLTILKKINDMSISLGGRFTRLDLQTPTVSRRIRNLAQVEQTH